MMKKFFEDNNNSLEFGLVCKSIPKSKIREAIDLLKPLVSPELYEYQLQQRKAMEYQLFGQVVCGVCGTRHHHSSDCWNCRSNSPG